MNNRVVVIGAGIGGLTTANLLAKAGYNVTILEAQTYPGGCAGTFFHKGYRFEAGATVAGGFQPNGPHAIAAEQLNLKWNVHLHDPAWVVHLPDRSIKLCQDNQDVLAKFPGTESFWNEQQKIADIAWNLSAQGLPFPPTDTTEFLQLAKVGLANFPQDLRLIPFAFSSVYNWLQRNKLHKNQALVRFLDSSLLISAQATTQFVNALYGATAIDLPRQGVYHVEGGIGGLAQTLVDKLQELGGEIRYRQRVTRITIQNGRTTGVYVTQGRRSQKETFVPADFVVANLTPWSLDKLLEAHSPNSLKREVKQRNPTYGAFALHLGIDADKLPQNIADHHQIITEMTGPLGEGRSIFISMSPEWDTSRAPQGKRAVTITTHTAIQPWWDLLHEDESAYFERKQQYTERILNNIDRFIPGFKASVDMILPGTPVTYQYYTMRDQGMVGGFPQTSLFKARSPRTGIPNIRLVGDSIFPGQSTAGVTLGAMRVADDIKRNLPIKSHRSAAVPKSHLKETRS